MALSTTMLESDLDYMVNDLKSTVVIGGVSLEGTRSEIGQENNNEGMYSREVKAFDFILVMQVSQFTDNSVTVPDVRTVITVDGTKYFIETKEPDQAGIGITFGLRRDTSA